MNKEEILNQYGIDVIYLNPISPEPTLWKSKIGGDSKFILKDLEDCPKCNSEMTLILELYKNEFPEFYFPNFSDYAQVKTCYNYKDPHNENDDIEFFISYGATKDLRENVRKSNAQISPVYLKPFKAKEIPLATLESSNHSPLRVKLSEQTFEDLIAQFSGRIGSKINGDGFKWHGFDDPVCQCGEKYLHMNLR